LSNCSAFRRLVVTGTPIQNNLDELFTIVDFIIPGYLGTLKEFQKRFVTPITSSSAKSSSSINSNRNRNNDTNSVSGSNNKEISDRAMEELRLLLAPILLRRTKEEILHDTLPPRKEFLVRCDLVETQWKEYVTEARAVLSAAQGSTTTTPPVIPESTVITDTATDIDDKKSYVQVTTKKRNRVSIEATTTNNDDNNDDDKTTYSFASVLPALTKMRQICNSTLSMMMPMNDDGYGDGGGGGILATQRNSAFVKQALEGSCKLQVN